MQKILCDECKKTNCEKRLKGAVCSVENSDTGALVRVFETRDPILFARKFVDILETERERYDKAREMEGIGEEEVVEYINKRGEAVSIVKKKGVDRAVTDLAISILKGAKIISEVASPKSVDQSTNIANQNVLVVNELRALPDSQREWLIKKFIDDKLDASEKDREIAGECVSRTVGGNPVAA